MLCPVKAVRVPPCRRSLFRPLQCMSAPYHLMGLGDRDFEEPRHFALPVFLATPRWFCLVGLGTPPPREDLESPKKDIQEKETLAVVTSHWNLGSFV